MITQLHQEASFSLLWLSHKGHIINYISVNCIIFMVIINEPNEDRVPINNTDWAMASHDSNNIVSAHAAFIVKK